MPLKMPTSSIAGALTDPVGFAKVRALDDRALAGALRYLIRIRLGLSYASVSRRAILATRPKRAMALPDRCGTHARKTAVRQSRAGNCHEEPARCAARPLKAHVGAEPVRSLNR